MKFIRKNGRVIPIDDDAKKQVAVNKAYYNKKLSDSDIEKNTVYRKATAKERVGQAKGLGVLFGMLSSSAGAVVGAADASKTGKSLKHVAKSAGKYALAAGAIGAGVGALLGGLSSSRVDNQKTNDKLYNLLNKKKKK